MAASLLAINLFSMAGSAGALEINFANSSSAGGVALAGKDSVAAILVETNNSRARYCGPWVIWRRIFRALLGESRRSKTFYPVEEKLASSLAPLGKSPIIDRLAAEGKLATNGVSGEWESYVLQIVQNPLPGVKRALVIAGSDSRGTIYGVYDSSERIRCFAVVLVGGCADQKTRFHPSEWQYFQARSAGGEVSVQDFFER